jgi:hypothetical protein
MCRIRLELYAQRSPPDLLVLGLLLIIIITDAFHCLYDKNRAQVTKKI